VANIIYEWLNFVWNRSMEDTIGFRQSPFTSSVMKVVAPKGACVCTLFLFDWNIHAIINASYS
jgi:hypothetical protein